MATSVSITLPQASRLGSAGSPLLRRTALAFLAFFILLYAGTFIDGRLINGVSVWEKPAKFFLSLSLHLATLSWGLFLLPAAERQTPPNPRHDLPHPHRIDRRIDLHHRPGGARRGLALQ